MNKCFLILFLAFISTFSVFPQRQKIKNQPYGDMRLYHFGLVIGLNFQDMIIANSGYTGDNGERWFGQIPDYNPGFTVGLLADYYLNQFMNLRFIPTLHFGDQGYKFKEESTGKIFSSTIRSNFLMFPFDVKFSSLRLNNYRPYVLAGGYGAFNLGRKLDDSILLKKTDYGVSIGLGCDFYLPIIKVCPEIKFYFGLRDLIEKNRPDLRDESLLKYTQAISNGTSRMIVLSFNFE
ncbi:MAG: PorT family protein [Candidatus Azobacteroides sp.]|nr:PorT family protein [Candidatus Azobacteroides sp.]